MRTSMVVVCVLTASSAYADELVQDPAASPGFAIMLRQDAVSRAGADLTYFFIDGEADATLFRLDMHGHYVDPVSGLGGYAQLPITFLSENDNSETVLGGAEVGGIYIPKLTTPGLGLVLRAGITLPTVSDDDEALIGLIGSFLRPTDVFAQLPQSSTLRFSASPMIRAGTFFARLDAGLDINVYADGGDTADPAMVLNIGAGVDLGTAAIMGEISTFAVLGDDSDSLTSAALSVRFHAGAVQPYAALLIPVDDDVSDVFDLGLMAGLEARL